MTKVCRMCKRTLEDTEFHKCKNGTNGLHSWCKECRSAYMKADDTKGQERRERNRACKETESYRAWVVEYDKTPERREKHRIDNRKPERLLQKREYRKTEHYKQVSDAYWHSETGKQVKATVAHRRRARLKSLVSDLTAVQWRMVLQLFDGKCAYCGSAEHIQQEHVIPVSRGGGTTIGNIVPACRKCNISKGNKTVTEWFLLMRCAT